jgi:LysR family transcriptional activator of nhaA
MRDAARTLIDGLPASWLNYQHLHYFWLIAREGSLTRAAARLRLTHSTLSAQVKKLEAFLGGELFDRRGRTLVLTPLGEDVAAYANDIFRLGAELVDTARGSGKARSTRMIREWRER